MQQRCRAQESSIIHSEAEKRELLEQLSRLVQAVNERDARLREQVVWLLLLTTCIRLNVGHAMNRLLRKNDQKRRSKQQQQQLLLLLGNLSTVSARLLQKRPSSSVYSCLATKSSLLTSSALL
jgi:hypothetical protein